MKKIINIFVLLFILTSVHAEVHKGNCGQNLKWRLDTETGILNITGYGDMTDYSFFYVYSPWRSRDLNNYIKTISFPEGLTHIGEASFVYCFSLTSFNIPDNVIDIAPQAFYGCDGLLDLTIGNGVHVIGAQAFSRCFKLKYIKIPSNVDSIGSEAFSNCTKLQAVYITDLSKWCRTLFHDTQSNPLRYAEHLYLNDIEIIDLVIPQEVTKISHGVFYFCKSIKTLHIHKNVTNIGSGCFGYCTGLRRITCEASEPPALGSRVFDEVDKSIPLYVPLESINKYKSADQWKDFYNIQSIEDVESIGLMTSSSYNQNNKIIQNGQILIQSGEKTYTITGAETKQ